MKNDDCPMCRTTLIRKVDLDQIQQDDSYHKNSNKKGDNKEEHVGSIQIVNGLISLKNESETDVHSDLDPAAIKFRSKVGRKKSQENEDNHSSISVETNDRQKIVEEC